MLYNKEALDKAALALCQHRAIDPTELVYDPTNKTGAYRQTAYINVVRRELLDYLELFKAIEIYNKHLEDEDDTN